MCAWPAYNPAKTGKFKNRLLVSQGLFQRVNVIDKKLVAGHKGRRKKGEPLNVVPVGVAKKEVNHALPPAAGAIHQF